MPFLTNVMERKFEREKSHTDFVLLQFVLETWRMMEENEIIPDSISSSLMIRALCKGGYLDEVKLYEMYTY